MPSGEQFGRDIDRYSLWAPTAGSILRFAAQHVDGPAVLVDAPGAR